jgi:hypothetical protein
MTTQAKQKRTLMALEIRMTLIFIFKAFAQPKPIPVTLSEAKGL